MGTIEHRDARGPEETVHVLSPVVPVEPASGCLATSLRESGMLVRTPKENTGELAQLQPRLLHRLAD
jgi:hypothetical protein